MKTLTLTMIQAVRVILMLDAHQGQRKELRLVRELRERIPISDETLQSYLTPVANGAEISKEVLTLPDIELDVIPTEARKLLDIIDAQTLTARDLVWAEPLAKQLEAIT